MPKIGLCDREENKMKKYIGLFFIVFTLMGCGDLDILDRIALGEDYYKLQLSPTELEQTLHKAQSGTYSERKEALEQLENTLFEFDTAEKRTQTLLTIEILNDVYDSSNTELKNIALGAMENIVTQSKKILITSDNNEVGENNLLQSKISSIEGVVSSAKSDKKKPADKP